MFQNMVSIATNHSATGHTCISRETHIQGRDGSEEDDGKHGMSKVKMKKKNKNKNKEKRENNREENNNNDDNNNNDNNDNNNNNNNNAIINKIIASMR
ncbi:hypothetical protein E2C01_099922 [Portunus trituberculatus]|uniref:Uncharacterized protein n=1 Tax=Portunus trituberculatus TaxID=210409 RepID=A0A5B7KI29_PORTR|nr:hypothetical protein [Portunus trituberculatus]